MKYRAEIDGLRAIAVLPVILFHAGSGLFGGGFVGVDIFFVISGYLITTIILSELESGTFSLVTFYERRARRILPALFFVMASCLPFAWFWLWPADMKSFSDSLVAVATFSSNFLFWKDTGYWATVNELKPLLHTWSLAVEEQYYILSPLFLMILWRFRKYWIALSFIVITLVSLAASQWGVSHKPVASFFLLPMRLWELSIGGMLAFFMLRHQEGYQKLRSSQTANELFGLLGLLLLGYGVFFFQKTTAFPGLNALFPTLGTALIILFTSRETRIGRFLSHKFLVGIGLISYSAYLWHQPILAFARHKSITEPNALFLIFLALLSLPLAYLSWKYVEQPFRNKQKIGRTALFGFALAGSLAFISIGMAGHITNGFENRVTTGNVTYGDITQKLRINHGLGVSCAGNFTTSPKCRTAAEPEIVLWGDSFTMHLVQGVLASKTKAKIVQMTINSCAPVFGLSFVSAPKYNKNWAKACLRVNGSVKKWLGDHPSVKYAVLSSPFDQYLTKDNQFLYRDGSIVTADMGLLVKEFRKTLKTLVALGIQPVIFSPPPANGSNLGRCLARAYALGEKLDICNFPVINMSKDRQKAYHFLEKVSKDYPVIRLDQLLCKGGICKTHLGSTFIFRDAGHLSHEGTAAVGKAYDFYGLITEKHSQSSIK